MLELFRTYVEQPIFNLLEFIYATVPGHDLGISIIIFTALIRLLLWPLVKKQLHQTKAMRKLQPQLKKLKKSAKGDRQKEARLQMELYKEHGVKPFSTIGTLIIQLPIFIALFFSIRKLIEDPNVLFNFSYSWVRDLPYIQQLMADVSQFEHTLLGVVDLSRKGIESGGPYIPAILVAIAAAIAQFYQSKLMLPNDKDAKSLKSIMSDAAAGKQADQSEVAGAVSRGMMYFLPFITFFFSISLPSALALYILTTSAVGYAQQAYVLNKDKDEMHDLAVKAEKSDEAKAESKKDKPLSKKKTAKTKKKRRR